MVKITFVQPDGSQQVVDATPGMTVMEAAKTNLVPGIEADHVTLAIENPHTEVQLLHYRNPAAIEDPNITKLNKLGFNHICFSVDDLEAEIVRLTAAGIKLRNRMMDFHQRKLVFLEGPEGVTIELAEWH